MVCQTLHDKAGILRSFYIFQTLRIQRCRSVFNIGGYNSAFLLFFRDFEILGGDIQVLPIFQVLTILKIWVYIQVLTKMYLNN